MTDKDLGYPEAAPEATQRELVRTAIARLTAQIESVSRSFLSDRQLGRVTGDTEPGRVLDEAYKRLEDMRCFVNEALTKLT